MYCDLSLLQNERRSEIERKIFRAGTISPGWPHRLFFIWKSFVCLAVQAVT